MKLASLVIRGFKNLQDITVKFDSGFDTFVMLGGNGTGKSNLMEAIVAIFTDVCLQRETSFEYRLDYECRGHRVSLLGSSEPVEAMALVDGEMARLPEPNEATPEYIPDNIIAYYSGPGSRLESHFVDHAKREHAMLRDPENATYSPFLYCEPRYSDFLLLACFASGAFRIREFVSGRMGIEKIESVLFDIVKPQLNPTRSKEIAERDGDERFWNATGESAYILGLLWDHALAPYRDTDATPTDFRGGPKRDHVYLFLKDQDALRAAAEPFGQSYGFFRHLCYLHTLGMVNDLTTLVQRRGHAEPLSFSEFSEGERQLITIVALLNMVEGGENLIMLDEPDTHLNPQWKYEYLQILRRYAGKATSNQLVIATHDPLLIGELRKEQVYLFQLDKQKRRVFVDHPEEDPIGQGVAGLLKGELFGLSSTIDSKTLEKLHRRYELYALGEDRTPTQTAEMHQLIGELAQLGFATEFGDPYYELFARAMSRRPEYQKPSLTSEEREEQEHLADKILDGILGAAE